MDPVTFYQNLSNSLKEQLISLAEELYDYSVVKDVVKHIMRDLPKESRQNQDLINDMFHLAIYDLATRIDPHLLFNPSWFGRVFCYSNKDHHIQITELVHHEDNVAVLFGRHPKQGDVAVKWYKSRKRTAQYEIDIYRRMKELGAPIPWFSTKYQFMDQPVLIMEKLQPIDGSDNPYEVGIQILNQLKYLHQIGVHCDLKPENIMKRVDDTYFMIDFGGVTTEHLESGYRRWIWNPKYTSQRKGGHNQLTSCKYDFIELCFVMKALKNIRKYGSTGEFRSRYHGKLLRYMNRVDQLTEAHSPENFIHDELISILSS